MDESLTLEKTGKTPESCLVSFKHTYIACQYVCSRMLNIECVRVCVGECVCVFAIDLVGE